MDHAATVEKKKNLLMAAGVNEYDAHHAANELAITQAGGDNGGPDPTKMAHGQGRRSSGEDTAVMYGSGFRANSHRPMGSTDSGQTVVQRPQAVTTGSQVGRFSYLGRTGVPQRMNSVAEPRLDSPAMTTNEELYAPLAAGGDAPLGHMVADQDPRYRYSRTTSSGV
jgi:aquaporin related protein